MASSLTIIDNKVLEFIKKFPDGCTLSLEKIAEEIDVSDRSVQTSVKRLSQEPNKVIEITSLAARKRVLRAIQATVKINPMELLLLNFLKKFPEGCSMALWEIAASISCTDTFVNLALRKLSKDPYNKIKITIVNRKKRIYEVV